MTITLICDGCGREKPETAMAELGMDTLCPRCHARELARRARQEAREAALWERMARRQDADYAASLAERRNW